MFAGVCTAIYTTYKHDARRPRPVCGVDNWPESRQISREHNTWLTAERRHRRNEPDIEVERHDGRASSRRSTILIPDIKTEERKYKIGVQTVDNGGKATICREAATE